MPLGAARTAGVRARSKVDSNEWARCCRRCTTTERSNVCMTKPAHNDVALAQDMKTETHAPCASCVLERSSHCDALQSANLSMPWPRTNAQHSNAPPAALMVHGFIARCGRDSAVSRRERLRQIRPGCWARRPNLCQMRELRNTELGRAGSVSLCRSYSQPHSLQCRHVAGTVRRSDALCRDPTCLARCPSPCSLASRRRGT